MVLSIGFCSKLDARRKRFPAKISCQDVQWGRVTVEHVTKTKASKTGADSYPKLSGRGTSVREEDIGDSPGASMGVPAVASEKAGNRNACPYIT